MRSLLRFFRTVTHVWLLCEALDCEILYGFPIKANVITCGFHMQSFPFAKEQWKIVCAIKFRYTASY